MCYELFDRYAIVVSRSTISKALRAMQITGGGKKRRRGRREGRVEEQVEEVEDGSGRSLEIP